MRAASAALMVGFGLLGIAGSVASGRIGTYAIVDKVVFETSEQVPERIQVWGAFALAVAGTGQAVAFGGWVYFGRFEGPASVEAKVRAAQDPPANPDAYVTNVGVVKLSAEGSHSEIVGQLRQALRK